MSSTSSQPPPATGIVRRHPKYYLDSGDTYFRVENYIFCVHRFFFERESAWFRERLALTTPIGQPAWGSCEEHPFPIVKVTAEDFTRFLWIFYNPKHSLYDAPFEDWVAILNLAFDWRFAEVKNVCIRELERIAIDPVDKIELYHRYELDGRLLIPSLQQLCMRPEPLSLREGRQIGLETSLLIANAREWARGERTSDGLRSPIAADLGEEGILSIIKDIFGLNTGPPSPTLDRGSEASASTSTFHSAPTSESAPPATQNAGGGPSNENTADEANSHQADQNRSADSGKSTAPNGNANSKSKGTGKKRQG